MFSNPLTSMCDWLRATCSNPVTSVSHEDLEGSNPLTPERLDRLKDEAKELLEQFSKLYLKNYGATVFEKIKEEHSSKKDGDEELKLKYRPQSEVKRGDLFTGECFVKMGEGPGAFGNWKQRFVVERIDYGIDIFADEKAYKAKKKPATTIRTAGYKVETEVSKYYADSMRHLAAGLGLTDAEVTAMTTFSRYSWALAHPQRTNFIFQLHKGKDSGCACLGGRSGTVDPDEQGADKRDDIIKYVNAMKRCVSKANDACNSTKETSRIAFRKACEQIPSKVDALKDWTDNGTEGEMLVDMLIEALLPPMREEMFQEMKGPASMKLTMWYKMVGVIEKSMVTIVEPVWEKIQQQAAGLQGRVENAVRPVLHKVLEVKDGVENKIKDVVGSKLNSTLSTHVTPFIKPIIDIFESPLKRGFESGGDIVSTKINVETLSQEKQQRDAYLDQLASLPAFVAGIQAAANDLVEPLKTLTHLNSEVFGDLKPEELCESAKDIMLQTLDAAAYTAEQRLDNGQTNDEALLQQLIADYKHDAVIKRCEFVKEVATRLLVEPFKKLVSPVTQPVIENINNAIPEQMQEFLNVENIIDKLIETLVEMPINQVVTSSCAQQE